MVQLTVFRHQRETEAVVGKSLQDFLLILRRGAGMPGINMVTCENI